MYTHTHTQKKIGTKCFGANEWNVASSFNIKAVATFSTSGLHRLLWYGRARVQAKCMYASHFTASKWVCKNWFSIVSPLLLLLFVLLLIYIFDELLPFKSLSLSKPFSPLHFNRVLSLPFSAPHLLENVCVCVYTPIDLKLWLKQKYC